MKRRSTVGLILVLLGGTAVAILLGSNCYAGHIQDDLASWLQRCLAEELRGTKPYVSASLSVAPSGRHLDVKLEISRTSVQGDAEIHGYCRSIADLAHSLVDNYPETTRPRPLRVKIFVPDRRAIGPVYETRDGTPVIKESPARRLAHLDKRSRRTAEAKARRATAGTTHSKKGTDPRTSTAIVWLMVVGTILAILAVRAWHRHAVRSSMRAKVRQAVKQHLEALARKRMQKLVMDDYGNPLTKPWAKEIKYFLETVVVPRLDGAECDAIEKDSFHVANTLVESVVVDAQNRELERMGFDESMDPIAYEHFCAKELCEAGWDAQATKGSGDQGVDVIAEKDGVRLVVQCKKYSHPVGNSAVQEITAGRTHERADFACVVSNADYTRSARQLASTNEVYLLHHMDLKRIDELLSEALASQRA